MYGDVNGISLMENKSDFYAHSNLLLVIIQYLCEKWNKS